MSLPPRKCLLDHNDFYQPTLFPAIANIGLISFKMIFVLAVKIFAVMWEVFFEAISWEFKMAKK